ncbi:hypothetical protein [Streptomyces nigrescens]|uniref:hypothetical protein n=1 Tax=Streptomyces nigrescens TaxID=1920 RepID=UPI0037026A1F
MFTRPRNHEPIPWQHAVISTPLFTAATVYTGGLALGLAEDFGGTLPTGWMAIGSIAGIAAASASRWFRTGGTPDAPTRPLKRWYHTGFTATWTTATYAWLNWTAHTSPWTMASAASIAAATAAFIPAYAVDRYLRQDIIAAQWADEAAADRIDQSDWEQLFEAVGARGVQVGKAYDTRGGYAMPLTLTQTPYEQVLPLLRMLEVRKGDLRTGSLRLVRGSDGIASAATLYVDTRNVLAETIPLPADAHPLTINEAITLGDLESGEPIEILFRQNSILIAGKKGSGKSVLLHVIIAAITRCTDAVIWMIDLAEGNTAKRWLRPWAEQQKDANGNLIDRPILDWVATSHEESVRLLEAALAVADGRARRMKGGKIIPKPEQPALIVISDENSDLMAWNPNAVQAKTRGVKKGRKAAVDYIDAVQRGTGPNTGGGEINSQYDTVFGGKFNKKAEGQFVFPDYYAQVDLSKLPGRGSWYLLDDARQGDGGLGPERGKVHFANDDEDRDDIEQLSVARWNIRPDLEDAAQQDAAPFGYHERWNPDRTEWLADALGMATADTSPRSDATAGAGSRPAAPTRSTGTTMSKPTDLPSFDDYIEKAKNWSPPSSAPATPSAGGGNGSADPTVEKAVGDAMAEFERWEQERIAREAATNSTQTPVDMKKADRRHPRRDEVTDWARQAGSEGITVADVRDRLLALYPDEQPPSDTAIQNWFASHERINKPGRGRYFWTSDEDDAGE